MTSATEKIVYRECPNCSHLTTEHDETGCLHVEYNSTDDFSSGYGQEFEKYCRCDKGYYQGQEVA